MKQYIPQKVCLRCSGCCRFAYSRSKWSPCLLDKEIKALRRKRISLGLRPKTKRLKLVFSDGLFFCPFFDSIKNRCRIYRFRPFDCQLYPFLLQRKKNKIYLALDLHCPYIKKTLGSLKFKKHLKELVSFLKTKNVKKIILDNPQITANYPEKTVINLMRLPF
ncbi:MAG: YkgJ family cysteine cluster protein [Candidatus Omnitrophica bacterium]|nr:YkgJ family cysteine cluster protein [Candidatus Omnitrophota bacterium]